MKGVYFRPAYRQPSATSCSTPYHKPMVELSLCSSGQAISSTATPPILTSSHKSVNHSIETVNIVDTAASNPQELTPTLHASLIAEIFSLRHNVDAKNESIARLETNLAYIQGDNEILQQRLGGSGRELREAKKQIKSIQDSSASIIEDLAKQKDEALAAIADLRKKSGILHKQIRSQDRQADETHGTFEREKLQWEDTKGLLERKLLVAENRLKLIIKEVVNYEMTVTKDAPVSIDDLGSFPDTNLNEKSEPVKINPEKVNGSSYGRHRSSLVSSRSISSITDLGRAHINDSSSASLTLAEELRFSVRENENTGDLDDNISVSDARLSEARQSRLSQFHDEVTKRMFTLLSQIQGQEAHNNEVAVSELKERPPFRTGKLVEMSPRKPQPVLLAIPDVSLKAIEVFPQLTPALHQRPRDQQQIEEQNLPAPLNEMPLKHQLILQMEIGPNQRRKRRPPSNGHTRTKSDPSPASQLDIPEDVRILSTLTSPAEPTPRTILEPTERRSQGNSTSYQSELYPLAESEKSSISRQATSALPTVVPVIAILPPCPDHLSSQTVSSAQVREDPYTFPLPGTASMGCQTDLDTPLPTRSIAVQTDTIRVDKRALKSYHHFLTPTINSEIPTFELPPFHDTKHQLPVSAGDLSKDLQKTRMNCSMTESPVSPLAPGPQVPVENDQVSLDSDADEDGWTQLRQRFISGRYVGNNDCASEVVVDDVKPSEADRSSSLLTSIVSAKHNKHGNLAIDVLTAVPDVEQAAVTQSHLRADSRSSASSRNSIQRLRLTDNACTPSNIVRQQSKRRPTVPKDIHVQSQPSRPSSVGSTASANTFAKSSSLQPPFVIPTRGSSIGVQKQRKLERHPNPKPCRDSHSSPTRHNDKQSSDQQIVWKTQSAGTLPLASHCRSTPVKFLTSLPSSSYDANGVQHPPLPDVDLKTYLTNGFAQTSTTNTQLVSTIPTGAACVGSSNHASVVDAITATMIGDWMWKHVRKWKSFGTQDSRQEFGKCGESRHKRWVWLSPYERAIMWSDKQPLSNAALLGKNGRKLPIQSVLDVVENSMLPKGRTPHGIFSRSILVLTPERTLKLTAMSEKRHYLWLTALSFLAHHTSHGIPDLTGLPPAPFVLENGAVKQSRVGSIRPARIKSLKKHARSGSNSGHSIPTGPQAPIDHPQSIAEAVAGDTAYAPSIPRLPVSLRRRSATIGERSRTDAGASIRSSSVMSAASSVRRGRSESCPSTKHVLACAPHEQVTVVEKSEDMSPRRSDVSADFGGNTNFFDAVALIRMPASASPEVVHEDAFPIRKVKMLTGLSDGDSKQDTLSAPENARHGWRSRRKPGFPSGAELDFEGEAGRPRIGNEGLA